VEAERRQVTVLFTDMVGFTTFSERSGEEAAYTLMRGLSKLMDDAVHEQGGVVQNFTGDGIMAVFGAPVAFEDAPLRACRAALQILDRLKAAAPDIEAKHGVRPQLRIGLNTGPAVVGRVQQAADAGITVLGDTVNFAARLQALAEPDSVFMSEATHGLVRGLVDESFAGEHTIKGKSEPQKVYRLDGVRKGTSRFEAAIGRGLSAFVGRERELEVLDRALGEGRSQLRVIDLAAEPGMGKSRLLYEFQQRIGQDAFILSGSCSPDGQQTPFLPFIEVVRGSFEVSAGEVEKEITRKLETGLTVLGLQSPQNLGLLLNLLGLKVPDGALTGLDGLLIGLRTRELLRQLLEARCRLSPVVMVIEDLHWIDSASEEVLGKIVDSESTLPLLLVTTRRPEYAPPWLDQTAVTKIRVEPLPVDHIRRLVQGRLGVEALPEALARQVTEKAEGNPLFAEEIVSFLTERGMLRTAAGKLEFDADKVAAALPGTVQNLLTARVDRLAAKDRALLQAASVVGRRFDPELLAAAVGETALDARLATMQALDLIRRESSDDYSFKHALVRDALYQSLLTEARTALHLKIAKEIERRSGNRLVEVAEVLAHHYDQTDNIEKAFAYVALSGKKSLGIHSLDQAERYLERALALMEATPSITDNVGFADLLADLTSVYVWKLLPAKSIAVVERYMERLYGLNDLPQSVIILSNHVFALMLNSRWREMTKHVEHCLAMAERLGDDRSQAYARANWVLAKCLVGESSRDEAERQKTFARAESDRVDDGHLHFLVAWACAWDSFQRGLNELGRDFARELQGRGRRTGDPRLLSSGLWIIAWFDFIEERYDDMFAHADEALRTSITPVDREFSELLLAMAMLFRGQIAESVDRLWGVRDRCCKAGWTYITSATDMPLGFAMALQGDMAGGVRFLEQLIEHNQKLGFVTGRDTTRLLLAELYILVLQSKELPPFAVIRKNLRFLIVTKLSGWNKALALVLATRDNVVFAETSHWRARIETDLGVLYLMKKRYAEADGCLQRARAMAAKLQEAALLAKIDAALAKFPPALRVAA
jgi:class 3 adenylate cyclase/tetratricopeptide (TPR) repeat protein